MSSGSAGPIASAGAPVVSRPPAPTPTRHRACPRGHDCQSRRGIACSRSCYRAGCCRGQAPAWGSYARAGSEVSPRNSAANFGGAYGDGAAHTAVCTPEGAPSVSPIEFTGTPDTYSMTTRSASARE